MERQQINDIVSIGSYVSQNYIGQPEALEMLVFMYGGEQEVPHLHIWDSTTNGGKFHTSVRLDKAEYYFHDGIADMLSREQKEALMKFLRSLKDSDFPDYTQLQNNQFETFQKASDYSLMSELDCYKTLVDVHVYLYKEEQYDMLTAKLFDEFATHLDKLKQLHEAGAEGGFPPKAYKRTILNGVYAIEHTVSLEI